MTSIRCDQCKVSVPLSAVGIPGRCPHRTCPVDTQAHGGLLANIRFEMDEIAIAGGLYRAAHLAMCDELAARNIGGAASYADEAAKIAGQLQTMTAHIAAVLRRDGHTVTKESVNDSAA